MKNFYYFETIGEFAKMRLEEFLYERGIRGSAICRKTLKAGEHVWASDMTAFIKNRSKCPSHGPRIQRALIALGVPAADLGQIDEFKPKA